jgi:hypothetical protein
MSTKGDTLTQGQIHPFFLMNIDCLKKRIIQTPRIDGFQHILAQYTTMTSGVKANSKSSRLNPITQLKVCVVVITKYKLVFSLSAQFFLVQEGHQQRSPRQFS